MRQQPLALQADTLRQRSCDETQLVCLQVASPHPKSPIKGTSVVIPINAGVRAMKTPAFQATPPGVSAEGGLASKYSKLIPTAKSSSQTPPNKKQKPDEGKTSFTPQQTDAAVARCQHYVGNGIPDKHVTPFQEDWAVNAVSMLPQQEW